MARNQEPTRVAAALTSAQGRGEALVDRLLARRMIHRLDPLLGLSSLRRFVLLTIIPVVVMLVLGARTSQFGHIDTIDGIFPLMTVISVLSPVAGLLSALAYGVADIIQKFMSDDIFYEGTKTTGDYWGAHGGYILAYSSLVLFGLLPGVLSRGGRLLARFVAFRVAGSRAQGAQLSRGAEVTAGIVGGALGGLAGGAIASLAYTGLSAPAFLLRPTPDHSCFDLAGENASGSVPGTSAAGGATGAGVSGAESARKEEEKPKDPCASERAALRLARVRRNALHALLQQLRGRHAALNRQWESTREAAYLSGAVDVAFMLGGLLAGAAKGAAMSAATKALIGNRIMAAAVKSFGQQATKEITKVLLRQKMSWKDLALSPGASHITVDGKQIPLPAGGVNQILTDAVRDGLVQQQMSSLMKTLQAGGRTLSGHERDLVSKMVSKNFAEPLAEGFGNLVSLGGSMLEMASNKRLLEGLRAQMRIVDDRMFELQNELEEAVEAAEEAQHQLELCLIRNPGAREAP